MGDEHGCLSEGFQGFKNKVFQLQLRLVIKSRKRFIKQKDFWIARESKDDLKLALLAM